MCQRSRVQGWKNKKASRGLDSLEFAEFSKNLSPISSNGNPGSLDIKSNLHREGFTDACEIGRQLGNAVVEGEREHEAIQPCSWPVLS